jgi:hypothetical protein
MGAYVHEEDMMLSKETKAVLVEARALLARGWTQGHYARTATGDPVASMLGRQVGDAVCWCAEGALLAVNHGVFPYKARTEIKRVIGQLGLVGPDAIVRWNDAKDRTQAEVLDVFDRAIANVEHREMEQRS